MEHETIRPTIYRGPLTVDNGSGFWVGHFRCDPSDPLGHDWTGWEKLPNPAGVERRCLACGRIEMRELP